MFLRPFHPDRFLASVYGTEPFIAYCRQRGIPFAQIPGGVMPRGDVGRWVAVLAQLPPERERQVERDLAMVNELADAESLANLFVAAAGQDLPADLIPGDAPLALRFLLHHPDAFHQVFFHREILDTDGWRNTRAPAHIVLEDLDARAAALAEGLREFFQKQEGIGRFCTVDFHRLSDAFFFVAHVADRPRLFEIFTESGAPERVRLRPDQPVLFTYYPQDGTILLQIHAGADERGCALFRLFARTVLGVEMDAVCREQLFALDLLKEPFHPLPDDDDMEMVRIRRLHFRYPERRGRRQVKLETVASDEASAIRQMIQAHMGAEGILETVEVCYAELQVRVRVNGWRKNYFIRLWPNRSSLSQTPLAG